MNQPEHRFWNRVQPMLQGHVQRLESAISLGLPDVNICWHGREYWIELKVWTPGAGVLIRKEQWAWHNRRMANGGCCFLLCGSCEEDEKDRAFFAPTSLLQVKAYGTQNKYVVVTNSQDLTITPMQNLRGFLKINLFTNPHG